VRIPASILSVFNGLETNKNSYARDGQLYKLCRVEDSNKKAKFLGSGAYSAVLQHPTKPKLVVKVTLSKVDGYHRYVEWVLKNKPLLSRDIARHFPNILHTKLYQDGSRITILEKLDNGPSTFRELSDRMHDTLDLASKLVIATGEAYDLRIDYHTEGRNTMYRGDTPVITDPWAHR